MRIALFVIIVFSQLKCLACSCIGENNIKEEFKHSDVVFVGKVIDKQRFEVKDSIVLPPTYKSYRTKYKLLKVTLYKGESTNDTVTIITGMGGGDCGYRFEIGKSYLVYAKYETKYFQEGLNVERYLHTHTCTRTNIVDTSETKVIEDYLRKQ